MISSELLSVMKVSITLVLALSHAQGGPRSAGDQGGTGPSQARKRREGKARETGPADETRQDVGEATQHGSPGTSGRAGSGSARSQ